MDRDLTQIVITHTYPDHYLGLEVVVDAFPGVRVMAYGETADEINEASSFKIEHWGDEVLGRNGARIAVPVERIDSKTLTVDDQQIDIIGLIRGDSAHAAALFIPSTAR